MNITESSWLIEEQKGRKCFMKRIQKHFQVFFILIICLFPAFMFGIRPGMAAPVKAGGATEGEEFFEDSDKVTSISASIFQSAGAENEVAVADEEDWESGFEDDFVDDDTESIAAEEMDSTASTVWSLAGFVQLAASYNISHHAPDVEHTDYRKLSRWRPKFGLELQLQLIKGWSLVASGHGFYDVAYAIKGRNQFTEEVLDACEYETELTDTYILGSLLPHLDVKIGRQVIVWGKSDNIRITDVLNPLDNREPGLIDIEDLRLPVAMARIDYYIGRWNITALMIPEIRFGKNPAYGSDFFPFSRDLFSQLPGGFPVEKVPAHKLRNYEYGLAVNGLFKGWDLSFYAAKIFEDQYHLDISYFFDPINNRVTPLLELRHSALSMGGAAVNIALGNWLIKSEIACLEGFEYPNIADKKTRLDLLGGVEYSGFTDMTLSLEAANRHLFDFDGEMKALAKMDSLPVSVQADSFQVAARITRIFFHDTLEITLLGSMLGEKGQDGAFERLSATYDVTDDFVLSGGVVLYQHGDSIFFKNIEDNDRVFLEFKFSF